MSRRYHGVMFAVQLAIAVTLLVLLATGCQPAVGYRYPHACAGHHGISEAYKGIYYCRDGHKVGAGWLVLHPHSRQARP